MSNTIQLLLIALAVLVGGGAIIYFYFSVDIFTNILKQPLKIVSAGMLAIDLAVIMIVLIAFESNNGNIANVFGIPLSTVFYILYFVGSISVIWGARKFTRKTVRSEEVTS